ncbi:hypothetical protein BDV11DRAFT_200470 [Aspergillus similis]
MPYKPNGSQVLLDGAWTLAFIYVYPVGLQYQTAELHFDSTPKRGIRCGMTLGLALTVNI